MYYAYLITDAFFWCYRDTFSDEVRIAEVQPPQWLIRFTPDVVAQWSRVLADSAAAWHLRRRRLCDQEAID